MYQLALLDRGTRAPALAVNHLLIGQYRVVDRVPVHLGLFLVDEALFHEFQEQALLFAVIIWIAGRKLARPIEREAELLELCLHRGDVLIGPGARMHALFHGRIFRWHAECVPAHRVQHVVALGLAMAGNHITHRIIAHMSHVQAA